MSKIVKYHMCEIVTHSIV